MSIEVRDDARLAGQVSRYHTWPHTRQQSVGEHSWQVARILMSIAPFRWHLVQYAVLHDIGELTTGDIPYPIKKDNPALQSVMDQLETDTLQSLTRDWGMRLPVLRLEKHDKAIFKLAEFIEMWEFGWEEVLRGNRFAERVRDRCETVAVSMIREMHDGLSTDSRETAARATDYMRKRRDLWA